MLIACPSCAKRYDITLHPLPTEGRKMRCANCGHSWLAMPGEAFMPQQRPYPQKPPVRNIDEEPAVSADEDDAFDMAAAMEETNSQDDIDALFGAMGDDADDEGTHPMLSESEPGEMQPVEDAKFEELQIGADGAVALSEAEEKQRAIETLQSVEAMANRRAQVRAKVKARRKRPRHTFAYAACITFLACVAFFREGVVTAIPPMAPVYAAFGFPVNLTGLDFTNVTFQRGLENGVEILLVKGEIRNVSEENRQIPAVRLALYDTASAPLYEWVKQVDEESLAPGQSAAFETRLTSPPAEASEIILRFTDRRPIRTSSLP